VIAWKNICDKIDIIYIVYLMVKCNHKKWRACKHICKDKHINWYNLYNFSVNINNNNIQNDSLRLLTPSLFINNEFIRIPILRFYIWQYF